jgi:hypothetical protein
VSKTRIPNPLARRHLLERELDASAALALADAYLEEGRREEALLFLDKAGASERLEAMVEEAIQDGDAFLLRSIADVTGREPYPESWERLADAAEAAGKLQYAATARRQAGRSDSP